MLFQIPFSQDPNGIILDFQAGIISTGDMVFKGDSGRKSVGYVCTYGISVRLAERVNGKMIILLSKLSYYVFDMISTVCSKSGMILPATEEQPRFLTNCEGRIQGRLPHIRGLT